MNYNEYYGKLFIEDLNTFRGWTAESQISHREDVDGVFAIQFHIIDDNIYTIAPWGNERIGLFAAALFFTVLVDQVCYTHFHSIYVKFQSLTRYPKLRGPCPGGCQNLHPNTIFSWFTQCFKQHNINIDLDYKPIFTSAVTTMKNEVFDFILQHAPDVDEEDFWNRCVQHFPY